MSKMALFAWSALAASVRTMNPSPSGMMWVQSDLQDLKVSKVLKGLPVRPAQRDLLEQPGHKEQTGLQ